MPKTMLKHLRALRVLFFAAAVAVSGGALANHNEKPPTVIMPDAGVSYNPYYPLHDAMKQFSLDPDIARRLGRTKEVVFGDVKRRIESGADVNQQDSKFGFTPLHVAAIHANKAMAELLIGKGANLEAKDKKGRTPLFLAAEFGDPGVVRALLEAGAQFGVEAHVGHQIEKHGIKDPQGRTILHAAALNPNNPAWILGMFLAPGRIAHIDAGLARDNNGNNILHYAASNLDGRLALFAIKEIFSHLLNPDETKWDNRYTGEQKMSLLKNIRNKQGLTPYDQAAWLHERGKRYDRSYGCVFWGWLGTCRSNRPDEILRLLAPRTDTNYDGN